MKAYETIKFEEYPDVSDIKKDARKSSVGKFSEKSGEYKPYTRSNSRKKKRRYLKRSDKARAEKIWNNLEG